MKVFIAVLFFIGAAAAQAPTHNETRMVVELLIRRGELLVENTLHEINELRKQGHEHLVFALEHQTALVEALVVDLKIQVHDLNKTHAIHHLHVIEEELLHRENRISEELVIIREQLRDHKPHNSTAAQLIAKGEELIKKAHATIEKLPHNRDAHAIEAEIHHIEALIKAIQAKPTGADLKKDEEQLARTEKTMEQLLARIGSH